MPLTENAFRTTIFARRRLGRISDLDTPRIPIAKELLTTFPFLEEIPNVGLGKNAAGYVLELKDYYAVGIVDAYEKLLALCPTEIKERWQFVVAH